METKPLGHKSYGHIAHMTGSRMTPKDKHISPGQQDIVTKKARDWRDLIIVQEKLDGSNVAVAKIDNVVLPLGRSGYLASTSNYEQHRMFAEWVYSDWQRFDSMLNNGERIVGEWLAQAHGTRYDLKHEPFVPFDIMIEHERKTYIEFVNQVIPFGFTTPRLIHIGQPIKLHNVLKMLEPSGHGAIDPVEGAVFRCEREGRVDFLCKYVRPDKVDGLYLPEIRGQKEIWNYIP